MAGLQKTKIIFLFWKILYVEKTIPSSDFFQIETTGSFQIRVRPPHYHVMWCTSPFWLL